MSVFGFIENFFFISLGIVFGLILLLVYHFKNRMAIAEKKSESMYGLLSAVVKEIKSLRGMFGLGGGSVKSSSSTSESIVASVEHTYTIPTKSDPEFEIPVERNPAVPSVVPSIPVEREVITLDLNASEPASPPKIVVSDVDSDLEESEESDSDSEYESDSESELEMVSESEEDTLEVNELDVESSKEDNEASSLIPEDVDLTQFSEQIEDLLPDPVNQSPLEEPVQVEVATENVPDTTSQEAAADADQVVSKEDSPVPSNEQLRKMNINQLKTIAIQLGITADTSKMKKPELIGLIQAK